MKKKTTIAIVIAALFAIVISTPSKGALEEQIKETTSTKIVTTIKSTTTKKTTTTTTTTSTTTKKVGSGKVEKIDLSTIPEYSGKPYVVINDNVPNFSSEELSTKGYEKYSDLDSLGRTRTAIASVGEDTMPKDGEERGSISAIKPSGWIQATYNNISGKYLYNRAHLIGWQLSAENANKKNLITGTKYLNVSGMLPFENMVADYIKETGNHVAYRITPIYEGNNLVASGVQMEAYSVEDDGEGISFNIYCYNVQPDIIINYKDGSSKSNIKETTTKKTTTKKKTTKKETNSEVVYITKTGKKYHSYKGCPGLSRAKAIYESTLDQAEKMGLDKCSKCY